MNILYTLNDKFVPQVAAGICSVCENNKKAKEITFYIFSSGITSNNKKILKTIVEKKYNRKINIIELEEIENYFDFEFDTSGWNKIVLARLLIGKILPKKVERVLYLDGDTIVRGNLEKLWNIDLKGNVLGMSIEPTINKERKKILNLEKYPYYNAGVLLVDLKKWRKDRTEKKILDFYKLHNGNLFANDQDAINGSLKDEIYTISPKYNFYNIFYQYNYKFMTKLMYPVKYISKKVYDDACNEPIIIHYLGEERPWRAGNTHKYKKDYKKYLNMTPYANTEDEKGWRLYFICWKLFNVITKPFPMFRYKLIDNLIPKFMDYRKKQLTKENKNRK